MKRHVALALALCLVVGCGEGVTSVPAVTECSSEQLTAFLDGFAALMERWDAAGSRTRNTPRISLSEVIGEMQEIKGEAASLDGPSCVQELQQLMVAYMEQMIKAYNLYMSGNDMDGRISQEFDRAMDLRELAYGAWEALILKAEDGG